MAIPSKKYKIRQNLKNKMKKSLPKRDLENEKPKDKKRVKELIEFWESRQKR